MNALLLEYSRIPKTTVYVATIKYGTTDETLREISFPTILSLMTGVPLESAIEELHTCVKKQPHEHVFIMQTSYLEKSTRLQKMHEVSQSLLDLIKNDLPKAKLAFAPITDWKGTSP